jgi:hypothetical protein
VGDPFGVNPVTCVVSDGWMRAIILRYYHRSLFIGEDQQRTVFVSDEISNWLEGRLNYPATRIFTTVLDPDQSVILESSPITFRIHWFHDKTAVISLLEVDLAQSDQSGIRLICRCAFLIRAELPARTIDEYTPLEEVLRALAESFGILLTAHSAEAPQYLYSGPWDGDRIALPADIRLARFGMYCKNRMIALWCFAIDLDKYDAWCQAAIRPVDDGDFKLSTLHESSSWKGIPIVREE